MNQNQYTDWRQTQCLTRIKPLKNDPIGKINHKLALKILENQSLSLEGTAKIDSHGDRIALTGFNLTPPLFVIGSFC